jgi:hypothetical protein
MTEPLKIRYQPLDALIPYARNSRTHSDAQVAQIAASIREFGWTNPVLVDGDRGIIAGHGRVLAARKLGIKEVPTIELRHLSEAQRRAYVMADNALALAAGWDASMLRAELLDLQDADFDLSLIGFSEDELAAFMASQDVTGSAGLTDPDDAPEVQPEPVTKPGDVWVMGWHRLLCGDSTRIDELERLCAGQMVDMWLTDPPYNVAY